MLLLDIKSNDDTKSWMNMMLNVPTGAVILFSHHRTQGMTLSHLILLKYSQGFLTTQGLASLCLQISFTGHRSLWQVSKPLALCRIDVGSKINGCQRDVYKKSSSFICPRSAHPNCFRHRSNNKHIEWSIQFYQLGTRGRLWSNWWIDRANKN